MVTAQRQYKKILLSEVVSYERNNKKHGKNVARIADSIKRNEYIAPIIIDENNIILAGHGRKLALEQLGTTEVEVLQVSGLTEKQKADFRIADNRTTELSEWDYEAVLAEIGEFELEDLKLDFPDLDFDAVDLNKDAEDEVPDMDNVEIIVQKGDLFQLGDHRLMCGDAMVDTMDLLNGVKVDMVWTDPPYGIAYDNLERWEGVTKQSESAHRNRGEMIIGDDKPFDPSFLLDLFTKTKEVFIWGMQYYPDKLGRGGAIVWNRKTKEMEKTPFADFELCWSKQERNAMARIKWGGFISKEKGEKRLHTTQKPIELADWFIERRGKEAKTIVDLFAGSGTLLIACEKHGKKSCSMELDPKYIQVILKRYYDYTKGQREIKCLNRDLDLTPILKND